MKDVSIIVIGTDGVGKTPIAMALAEHYGLPYFKFANEVEALKSAGHPGQHMLWFDYGLTQLMEQTGLRIVSDRGYPCEWVYANYFMRKTDEDLISDIDWRHHELGTIIVWLYDSKIDENAKDDPHVQKSDIPGIQRKYNTFLSCATCCKYVSYDVNTSAFCKTDEQRRAIDVPNIIELIDTKRRGIQGDYASHTLSEERR